MGHWVLTLPDAETLSNTFEKDYAHTTLLIGALGYTV